MQPPDSLQTARLRLRRPTPADAGDIFANYAQDAEVTRYLVWRPHADIAETHEFLTGCLAAWEAGTSLNWAIETIEQPGVIGMVGCRPHGGRPNLGYVLARPYWGQGYMTEAVGAIVEWLLREEDVFRVWATCDVQNISSARVLEKVGMEREGVLRRWEIHPNISPDPRDAFVYSRVKSSA